MVCKHVNNGLLQEPNVLYYWLLTPGVTPDTAAGHKQIYGTPLVQTWRQTLV